MSLSAEPLRIVLPARMRLSSILTALVVGWFGVLLVGFYVIIEYEVSAGTAGVRLAGETQLDASLAHRRRLTLFIHPRCSCSRATIAELARVMEAAGDTTDAQVLFVQPPGNPDDWTRTELWKAAELIPGVQVGVDLDGRLAATFGATTSGHAVLDDGSGRPLFSGGITGARGHFGANASSDGLIDLLKTDRIAELQPPVFGCPLATPISSRQ